MTQKLNIDNGLQGRWTRTTGYNRRLAFSPRPVPIHGKDTKTQSATKFFELQNITLSTNPEALLTACPAGQKDEATYNN